MDCFFVNNKEKKMNSNFEDPPLYFIWNEQRIAVASESIPQRNLMVSMQMEKGESTTSFETFNYHHVHLF